MTNDEQLAEAFSALGDPRRVRALRLVAGRDPADPGCGDAVCACEVEEHLDLSQPATSYHMKVLRQAGLVSAEKRGRWVHYRITREGVAALRAFLDELTDAVPARTAAGT